VKENCEVLKRELEDLRNNGISVSQALFLDKASYNIHFLWMANFVCSAL
jgi:hypothetical protein